MQPGTAAALSAQAALTIRGLSKSFGATQALRDVDLDLPRGEILALLGQNGAGKSTLVKILAGVVKPDAGEIRIDGELHDFDRGGPSIAFIHQDLGLIEWMTVAENIAMAQGFKRKWGMIDWQAVTEAARASLARIAPGIDPRTRISDLTRTEKSLVAIARALATDAEILVLDEPTASLPADEVARLFTALKRLKQRGVGMVYVSHRLDEVFEIADRMVVLRDGKVAGERRVAETTPEEVILLIVGREPSQIFRRPTHRE